MIITCSLEGTSYIFKRRFPLIAKGSTIRIATVSANLPAGKLSLYEWQGGYGEAELTNVAGRYFFQPCQAAIGTVVKYFPGVSRWEEKRDFPVLSIGSTHYSPNEAYIPAVVKDSSGNVGAAYGVYDNGQFAPFMVRNNSSNPPVHDVEINGSGIVIQHVVGVVPNTEWTRVNCESSIWNQATSISLCYCGWFLVKIVGQATFANNPIVCNIRYDGTDHDFEIAAEVITVHQNGNTTYKLIKPATYQPSIGPSIEYLNWADTPRLKVSLSNGSSIQVMSWGFDVWPQSKGRVNT